MPLKIYSDNVKSAIIVDESSRSYKQVPLAEARKINQSMQSSVRYNQRLEQFIENLCALGYEEAR